ncbi:MAG: HlyD family efflux transporter periplasmic adaptor subunit [Gemmataceae bacterium]
MRNFVIPLTAASALAFAVTHVVQSQQTPPPKQPLVEPAQSPYARTVAGAGLVEARTENIAVGPHLPGVVVEVTVEVGQYVKAGDVLFQIDDRQHRAELKLREANLASAQAQYGRMRTLPRSEEVPPSEAKVREAKATLDDMLDQERRARQTVSSGAISGEEFSRRKQAAIVAREQLTKAEADLALLKAGAWSADLDVSKAAVAQAEAMVEQTKIELERLKVRAPVDGVVLQRNVRPGEYVGAPANQPLIVLGNLDSLHVRVDFDENDIHRFDQTKPTVAHLRGDPRVTFALKFVRVEPFVIPKKALTGDNVERVDTRVLQVIYTIDPAGQQLYVGQQVDVFQQAGG